MEDMNSRRDKEELFNHKVKRTTKFNFMFIRTKYLLGDKIIHTFNN